MTVDKNGFVTSVRGRVWQKIMVAAINAMPEPPLSPDDDRWAEFQAPFALGGWSGVAFYTDAGFDEVCVKAILEPTEVGIEHGYATYLTSTNLHKTGVAYAAGWLERRKGRWLQVTRNPTFYCRKDVAEVLRDTDDPEPVGFLRSGKFMM